MRDENYLQIPGRTQNTDPVGSLLLERVFFLATNLASEGIRTDGWILPDSIQLSYILLLIVLDLCMLCC